MKINITRFIIILLAAFTSFSHQSDVYSQKIMQPSENYKIKIGKKKRVLELFEGGKLKKAYKISLGAKPEGDKEIEGDGKTPEGKFYIFTKNEKSAFFLSLGLSYPNIEDAERGLKKQLISKEEHDEIIRAINAKEMPLQKTKLGGEIYIHGGGCDEDWTQGCIALKNEEMQEIFDIITIGAEVIIKP